MVILSLRDCDLILFGKARRADKRKEVSGQQKGEMRRKIILRMIVNRYGRFMLQGQLIVDFLKEFNCLCSNILR